MTTPRSHRAPASTVGARSFGVAAILVAASASVLAPSSAHADDFSFDLPVFGHTTFSMTSTTTARYRGNNYDTNLFDDDFGSLQQRFDLALQGDELRLEVRLDTFLPFGFERTVTLPGSGTVTPLASWFGDQAQNGCTPGREASCYLSWDVRPERIVLRWDHESWSVELGDTQLVIGRGVALSFRKVDLLGVDNALRGAHVRFDDGHFRFRLHTGLANPQNQDPITLRIFQDPADIVAAGTVGVTFGPSDMFALSGHAVRVWFEEEGRDFFTHTGELRYDRSVDVLGWTFEAPSLADGHLALYAEANGLRRTTQRSTGTGGLGPEEHEFGRGIYASAQLLADNLTVLVEWKDYTNFLVAPTTLEGNPWRIYSAAPSLEFDGPQRLRVIGNQRGGSVRVDYAFLPGPWQFSVNGSFFGLNEENLRDPFDGILVTHGWLTLQKRQEYGEGLNWSVNASAGFRQETLLHDVTGTTRHRGDMDRRMIHGMLDVTLSEGEHSFDIVLDQRYEQEVPFDSVRDFQVGGVSLTYTYNIQLALSLGLRWTNYKVGENVARAQRDYNFLGGEMYPSLEVRWNFDPGTFLRGFVGTTPGGTICSGGVCREVPPFEGVLLQFVGRL
ncbi:MAG: hypothetical protein K1X94_26970 [Sandaracinaceae bacterium]|nr:hypothetical protein [Sandaracinaceae bacterium]